MFAHVRRTGGGDVGESLLLNEGAGKIFRGEGGSLFYDRCLKWLHVKGTHWLFNYGLRFAGVMMRFICVLISPPCCLSCWPQHFLSCPESQIRGFTYFRIYIYLFDDGDICILLSIEAQLRPYCTCTLSSCPQKPIFVFLALALDDLTVVKGNLRSGHLLAVQTVWMGPYGVIWFPAGTRLQLSPLRADLMSDLINDNVLVCLMTSLLMALHHLDTTRHNGSYSM